MQTPREPTSLKNRLLFLWCCCCACPVIGIVFITYACLDFFYTSIPENQTYTIAIVFFFVGIAIMATSCFCCCVILTKIYAPSDDPAGGTLGLGCDFRKVPHVVLGTGLGFSLLDNEESNDTSRPKGLEKAGLGATLIQWIYRPTPHSVQIINDLDLDISVMVEECSFIAWSFSSSTSGSNAPCWGSKHCDRRFAVSSANHAYLEFSQNKEEPEGHLHHRPNQAPYYEGARTKQHIPAPQQQRRKHFIGPRFEHGSPTWLSCSPS